jgi:flagellar motor switch protein FliM
MVKLNAAIEAGQKPVTQVTKPIKWNAVFDDMKLRVTAELPQVHVTAGQLANLKPGDLIPIAMEMVKGALVCLEGTPKFVAVLGMEEERWAVKIVNAFTT